MQVNRRVIEQSLSRKGFEKKVDGHHRYFHHMYKGLATGAYAYTSHGSDYRSYGRELLGRMKGELKLRTMGEVVDLVKCPMSGEQYNDVLRSKGLLTEPSKASGPRTSTRHKEPRRKRRHK